MSQENIVPFEAPALTPEAVQFVEDFNRLKVEYEKQVADIESKMQLVPLNMNQMVSYLSRKGRHDLLDKISNRLETGARALAREEKNTTERDQIVKSIVNELSEIWDKRHD